MTTPCDHNEMKATEEALSYYMAAFYSEPGGNTYGQDGVLGYLKSTKDEEFLWVHLWFGRNHQRIRIGDTVRMQSPNDEPEFTEAEVLDVTTFAAYLLHENGADWQVWPLVHRMDNLHTEPEFDASHWVPVQRHMGYSVKPEDAAIYAEILADRTRRLTVIR